MKKIALLKTLFVLFTVCVLCSAVFPQESNRDSWQQPEKIIDAVEVKSGMTIGEAGAGTGYFTFYLAARVGDSGRVYANDIKKDVLKQIKKKCNEDSIHNVITILGKENDPLFPKAELDMVIMMRAFHEFTKPVEWMKNVIPALKDSASLIIIDLDPDRANYGWHHFMTREKVLTTMQQTDFELVRMETFLEKDNIYTFRLNK